MPILFAGLEGEYALFQNDLNTNLGVDDQRRGTVEIPAGEQAYRAFTASGDVWIHARIALRTDASVNQAGRPFLTVYAGADTPIASIVRTDDNDANAIQIVFTTDASPANYAASSIVIPMANETFVNFDIHISGTTVRFYKDEVLRYTGTASVGTGANAVSITYSNNRDPLSGNEATTLVQDFIVTDAVPTVGMELVSLPPAALGNHNDFTNDYYNINGPGYDPSTTIYTDTIGHRESWIYADSDFELGDKIIYAFVMTTVAQLSPTNTINDFQPFVRIDGVNYAASSLGADAAAPDAYSTVLTTNPATGQPWSRDDFRGLEAGVLTV